MIDNGIIKAPNANNPLWLCSYLPNPSKTPKYTQPNVVLANINNFGFQNLQVNDSQH